MSQPRQLKCDHCQHEFMPQVKDKPLPGGAMVRQFRCPNCKHIYVVARFTALGVRLMQQIQGLSQADPDFATKIDDLRAKLKNEITGA